MERLGLRKAMSAVCKELTVGEVVTDASVSIIAMLGNPFLCLHVSICSVLFFIFY